MKKIPFFLLLLMLLAGCQRVTVSKPLPPAQLSDGERAELEGTWVSKWWAYDTEVVYTVHFVCDSMAHVAWVDWNDDSYRLHEEELIVSHGKPRAEGRMWRFFSWHHPGKYDDQYQIMRFQYQAAGEVVVWLAAFEPFQNAVESGKLKGEVFHYGEDNIVRLTDPAAVLRYIEEEDGANRFLYQDPIVLHKVAEGKIPEPLPKCK